MHDHTRPDGRQLSIGPFAERPTGELRAHLDDTGIFVCPDWRQRRARWLRGVLAQARVELGAHDLEIVEAVAVWEPEMVHVIGTWITAAAQGRAS